MSSSTKSKILIALRILFGLVFVAAAAMKLTGQPQMVTEFDVVGLGQWFRYVTGAIELGGALLLIRAKTVWLGAGLLTCVSVGAFFAQMMRLHGDMIHAVVFALVLGWIAYCYRPAASAA